MNFFESIISPFIFFIEKVFLFSYQITGNYGVAIILLSFSVSLLLLPIFIFIEKSKKKDDIIKQKMKPLIDEIKRVYKGQERYYYIKTINRQHNYSSLKALIPILSLLIQIPFFIAAYQYLEHFGGLQGVSFAFIKDLGKPDGVFGEINILPILMTIVNLVTVYFYTRLGDGSERKQMLVIAIAFLVLLFNLPAGLVLYWTMNNVFSFFRLFITNPEVFKKQETKPSINIKKELYNLLPKLKVIFVALLTVLVSIQFNWAFAHNFNDIYFRLLMAIVISVLLSVIIGYIAVLYKKYYSKILEININPIVFYSLIFLGIYFHLSAQFYYSDNVASLEILSLIFILSTQVISFLYIIKTKENINKLIKLTLYIIAIYQFVLFVTLFTGNISINIAKLNILINVCSFSDIIVPGIVFSAISNIYYLRFNNIEIRALKSSYWYIVFFSLLYIVGFIFLWNPLSIFSSDPENFAFPAIDIVRNNINLFLIYLIVPLLVYVFSPSKIKYILQMFLLIVVIVSFINNTVFPINVGTLQQSKFLLQENLAQSTLMYIFEGASLIIIFLFVKYIINKKFFKYITIALVLLNVVLISQSVIMVLDTGRFWSIPKMKTSASISFSKDKDNVIFFVSDMFHGWNMKRILEEEPELRNELSGFTWYSNTLSVSSTTCPSMPAILGGFDYTIDKLNKDTTHTMGEKMTKITEDFYSKVKDRGYGFTSTDMIYSAIDKNKFDSYLPKWNNDWDKWNSTLHIGMGNELGYELLWKNALFYSAPLFLKSKIYKKGRWVKAKKYNNENDNFAKRYNFIRLLPFISNTDNKKSSFIYIHSMVSHHPWDIVTDDGVIHNDVSPYENNKWVINAFVKWLKWMKENGVYNNTKIILLSDHGIHWKHFKGKVDDTMPLKNYESSGFKMYLIKGLYPLLLVKEKEANFKLKEDKRFMSNADASYILFDKENPTTVKPPLKRVLPTTMVPWTRKIKDEKYLPIYYNISVTNTAYDLKNWELK